MQKSRNGYKENQLPKCRMIRHNYRPAINSAARAKRYDKTEISVEVFNRHASSAEIDEALRLLHGLHMVSYETRCHGGGAPASTLVFLSGNPRKKRINRSSTRVF